MADRVECVVIGAGAVGLAVARALALAGREVLLLEAETHPGTITSARNSGVIHSGIYYPGESLKARFCVRGRALLYDYAAARGLAHRQCGKLIVAQEGQQDALERLRQQALLNGVADLVPLTGAEAREFEQAVRCAAALWCPSTGIIDPHE